MELDEFIAAQEEGILSEEDLDRDEGAWLGSFFLWMFKHPAIE